MGTVMLLKTVCKGLSWISTSAKKNVLFFLMGPPTTPPNWLYLRRGATWAKKSPAFSTLFCQNSKSVPRKLLVPDFMTAMVTAPVVAPYSAESLFVRNRTSWMVSMFGLMLVSPPLT